jgi:tRNA-specific 2-thiouridylase
VDSSVAAALLKHQGYDVVGIFMKLWAEEKVDSTDLVRENICCSVEASTAARAVAEKIGIPFYVVNFQKEFREMVVQYYIDEYEAGRTPNPCVICNRDIKGELLLKKATELGADYLATGHYASIKQGKDKKYHLFQGVDKNKDQTYFLWTLTQEKLAHILFPVGGMTKPEVREVAAKLGLPTATRRESQGICFIPDRNVGAFLRRYAKNLTEPGEIHDLGGKVIGTHDGLINYTIGQREGLGLGGPKSYYVVRLNSKQNILVVGDDKDLFQKTLVATDLNWLNKPEKENIGARIRHGHPIEECRIKFEGDDLKVIFKKAQRAITSGQSIVLYDREEVLGGGIISGACDSFHSA